MARIARAISKIERYQESTFRSNHRPEGTSMINHAAFNNHIKAGGKDGLLREMLYDSGFDGHGYVHAMQRIARNMEMPWFIHVHGFRKDASLQRVIIRYLLICVVLGCNGLEDQLENESFFQKSSSCVMQQGSFHSSLSSIMDSGCMRLFDKIALTILMGISKTWHCLVSKTTSSVFTANP
ncbi:predicted protein [Lichtheimia corymbifera JMRC:FSU:9682]|uniref:Uncharacterized protein n=1 Tax=Lichtheimia corymbifera JMRC:FSU:9682 TaxID=1263082 RepID=A0A068SGW3_9FUNG|nr:predicted protein [Lichtheimia corymbifera JMRC:FSU:9682]